MLEEKIVISKGKIRVGRCVFNRDGSRSDPCFQGFTPIVVLTKTSQYGQLGPYVLTDEHGVIVENRWQGSKVNEKVHKTTQKLHKNSNVVIWDHPSEVHAKWDEKTKSVQITPAYLKWREKLFKCKYPVRYPVGYEHRHECLFALNQDENGKLIPFPLSYIEARKAIYVPVYEAAVRKTQLFQSLKSRLEKGENLLIIEVDGPHEESMPYYIQKYDVPSDFIVSGTLLCTVENLKIVLNDDRHPYGHGYCLAAALLDLKIE